MSVHEKFSVTNALLARIAELESCLAMTPSGVPINTQPRVNPDYVLLHALNALQLSQEIHQYRVASPTLVSLEMIAVFEAGVAQGTTALETLRDFELAAPDVHSTATNLAFKAITALLKELFKDCPVSVQTLQKAQTAKSALRMNLTSIVVDIDAAMWNVICKVADESTWMPEDYVFTDWVNDVIRFLENGPQPCVCPETLREAEDLLVYAATTGVAPFRGNNMETLSRKRLLACAAKIYESSNPESAVQPFKQMFATELALRP